MSTAYERHSGDRGKSEGGSGPRGTIVRDLLLAESEALRRSILLYQVVGRILFVLLVGYRTTGPEIVHRYYAVAAVSIVLGVAWLCGSLLAFLRQEFISRLVAEADFAEDPRWAGIFIEAYRERYRDTRGRLTTCFILVEPVVWTALALFAH
jgi:hypothetical protein